MNIEEKFSELQVNLNKVSSSENDQNSIKFGTLVTHIYLCIKDKENADYKSKCISMILDFSDTPQDVSEISFKNYYTYTVSVLLMKISYNDPNRYKKWYIAIEKKVPTEKYG